MKNIAICYSEHAIKVSDSYCSSKTGNYNSPHLITTSIKNAVTSIYKVNHTEKKKQFLIRLTWCNNDNLPKNGFSIGICDYPSFSTSKFRVLRKEKGQETFETSDLRIETLWDFSRAKYGTGPEPITGFCVVVLVNSEISLILGDMEQEIVEVKKRRVSEFSLVSRFERFSGNSSVYSTKAKFCETGACHEILIKCSGDHQQNRTTALENLELCIYIDKKSVIKVKRLHWNFRGNETIFLDGLLVDFMWNVHDWLFGQRKRYAVFLFRTRRGVDSRLWLEEKINFLDHQQQQKIDEQEKVGFSFLICACKNRG